MGKDQPTYVDSLFSVAENTGLGIVGRTFFFAIRFTTVVMVTRNLGAELYGIYITCIGVLELASVFTNIGLGAAMVKFGAQYIATQNFAKLKGLTSFSLKTALISGILITALVMLSAEIAADRIFLKPELASALRIAILGLPFLAITSIVMALFQGAQLLKYCILIGNFIRPTVRFALTAVVLGVGFKLFGVLFAWISAIVISLIATLYIFQKNFGHIREKHVDVDKKEVLSYAVPLWFSNIFNQNKKNICIVLIGAYLTAEQVGIYGIGFRMMPFLLMPFIAYNTILAPIISSLYTRGEIENLEKLCKTGSRLIMTLSLPLFFLMVLFSQEICLIFGSDFTDSAKIVVVLLTAQMINISSGSSYYILAMTGKSNYMLINSIFSFFAVIILTIGGLKLYGIIGAAYGFGISLVLLQIIQLIEVWRLYRFHPYSLQHLKPIWACLSSVIIFFGIKDILGSFGYVFSSILAIAVFLISYVFFIQLFKLSPEDRILINRIRLKLFRIPRSKKSSLST